MIHTPAEILRAFILAQSGAVYSDPVASPQLAWPLYVSALPDGTGIPNNAAALYDTSGEIQSRLLRSGSIIESFGVQLKNRATLYSDAYSLTSSVADSLSKISRPIVMVNGLSYTIDTVRRTSSIISMGQDEKRRAMCSVNFLMMLIQNPN